MKRELHPRVHSSIIHSSQGMEAAWLSISGWTCHSRNVICMHRAAQSTVVRYCMCAQSCWLCNPADCSPPGSSVHGILQQEYWSGLPCPPEDLPYPGIEPGSPTWQADSLPPEPLGKLRVWYCLAIKKRNLALCNNIDVPWGHYAKWSKSERQILYDLTYI